MALYSLHSSGARRAVGLPVDLAWRVAHRRNGGPRAVQLVAPEWPVSGSGLFAGRSRGNRQRGKNPTAADTNISIGAATARVRLARNKPKRMGNWRGPQAVEGRRLPRFARCRTAARRVPALRPAPELGGDVRFQDSATRLSIPLRARGFARGDIQVARSEARRLAAACAESTDAPACSDGIRCMVTSRSHTAGKVRQQRETVAC